MAFDLLARREHSRVELFRKLQKKGFNGPDIDLVLDTLGEEGLQSDRRFIENFIRYQRNRGYGPLQIHAELKEKGIHEDIIEEHLNISDNTWLVTLKQVWQKKFKNALPSSYQERARQMRFLHYRGFTFEQINSIMKNDEEQSI